MSASSEVPDEGAEFIKQELLPEMVHDRCFCESGSREFAELESASAEPLEGEGACRSYRASVVVRFSGEPREFPLFVKTLAGYEDERAFRAFQNEEMFYSKMAAQYRLDVWPKCYAADLGKYGRPVLVLEDLHAAGYREHQEGRLDEHHLRLCLRALAAFHAAGLRLKVERFPIFREFEAKLHLESYCPSSSDFEIPSRVAEALGSIGDVDLRREIARNLAGSLVDMERRLTSDEDALATICQGDFSPRNVLFKREGGKAVDAKLLGWQKMRRCSPAVDLGGALLRPSLVAEGALTTLQETLTTYFEALKHQHPWLTWPRFKRDVVAKLPSTCLILSRRGDSTAEELLLPLLERLAAFN